jgi:exodeoxyribonuclease VII small subunit
VDDVTALRFEEAYALLEETLQEMRQDGLALERALALYERGMRLAAHCDRLLAQAELRMTELTPAPGEAIARAVRESLDSDEWLVTSDE